MPASMIDSIYFKFSFSVSVLIFLINFKLIHLHSPQIQIPMNFHKISNYFMWHVIIFQCKKHYVTCNYFSV
jgi:hypothetical protein